MPFDSNPFRLVKRNSEGNQHFDNSGDILKESRYKARGTYDPNFDIYRPEIVDTKATDQWGNKKPRTVYLGGKGVKRKKNPTAPENAGLRSIAALRAAAQKRKEGLRESESKDWPPEEWKKQERKNIRLRDSKAKEHDAEAFGKALRNNPSSRALRYLKDLDESYLKSDHHKQLISRGYLYIGSTKSKAKGEGQHTNYHVYHSPQGGRAGRKIVRERGGKVVVAEAKDTREDFKKVHKALTSPGSAWKHKYLGRTKDGGYIHSYGRPDDDTDYRIHEKDGKIVKYDFVRKKT